MKKSFKLLATAMALSLSAFSAKAGLEGNLIGLGIGSESINLAGKTESHGAVVGFDYGYAINCSNFLVVPELSFGYTLNNFKDADAAKLALSGLGQTTLGLGVGLGYDFGKGAVLLDLGASFRFHDKAKYLSAEGSGKKVLFGAAGFRYGAAVIVPLGGVANLKLASAIEQFGISKDLKDAAVTGLAYDATTIKDRKGLKIITHTASLVFNF
jgi:hypothetical protein